MFSLNFRFDVTFWAYESYSICKKLLNSYPIFIKQKVTIFMRFTLSEVVERYQRNIYVAVYAIVRNSDDANDVVQDTFLQYYTKIRQFESEEHIKAWLLRVAINKATDITRSFWHRFRSEENPDIHGTMPAILTERESLLNEAVMQLPLKQRIVIHLHYYEDYSIREIADILGLTESSIKMRLMRGRESLRKVLKEESIDE